LASFTVLLGANAIYPGLVLRIPAPDQVEAATEQVTHTVQAGETLSEIAIQYDTSVDRIVAANDLVNPARLSIGQVINIPAPGAAARPSEAVTATVHRVQAGETLAEIAIRYGVAPHTLAVANGISTSAELVPGQQLSIPDAQVGINSVAFASVGEGLCEDVELQGTGTGYFTRPVKEYALTQGFHQWHAAVDLAYDLGTPVYAADGGTVVYSGWNPTGYGNLVILDHNNGWRTYYAHLNAIFNGCGEWVGRGDILGEMGNTGNSTGPHLHFEMLRFGTAVNPVGYIRF
jgi:murein DD-endopeptidase MepM/ murein hydrolase activator NlpD